MKGLLAIAVCAALAACSGNPRAASTPAPSRVTQTGVASWYGPGFHGKATTSGERYDQHAMTAAHKTLPLGTRVRVTNLSNARSVDVRINDRGPFVGDRIIDLSFAAATKLEMVGPGTAEVRVEVLESPVALSGIPSGVRYAVQVGSFTSRTTAESARERAAREAKDVAVVSARAGSQTLYRVRVGDFADINDARAEAQRLKRAGIDGIVVER